MPDNGETTKERDALATEKTLEGLSPAIANLACQAGVCGLRWSCGPLRPHSGYEFFYVPRKQFEILVLMVVTGNFQYLFHWQC